MRKLLHKRSLSALILLLCSTLAFRAAAQQTTAPQAEVPQTQVPQVQADLSPNAAEPAPSPESADIPPPTPSVSDLRKQQLFHDLLRDEYGLWTAPFRPSNYDSHGMKRYGAPFLLISAALIVTDRRTADLLPNTTDQTLWSGRVSQIGAPYTLAGFSGAMYLVGKAVNNRHSAEAGLLGLEAIAHSEFITLILKEITQRERPLTHDRRGGFWEGGDSFPSGHAAGAFALASVLSYEYRQHIAVPIVSYSLASIVAASRMSARRHWVSDIFVGSSMGFMVGRYIYKQHHDSDLPGSPVRRASRLIPALAVGDRGPGLYWTF